MTAPPYSYLSDREEHENWVRCNAVELAIKLHPYKPIDEIVKVAEAIERYVLKQKPTQAIHTFGGQIIPIKK